MVVLRLSASGFGVAGFCGVVLSGSAAGFGVSTFWSIAGLFGFYAVVGLLLGIGFISGCALVLVLSLSRLFDRSCRF